MPVYAVIDLGSFTTKLTIANFDKQISVIEKDERSIGLGQNFLEDRLLKSEAISRAVKVIHEWQKKIEQHEAVKTGIFATGVSQIAQNRDQFIDSILRKTGLLLRILTGEDEARILFKGVVDDFPEGFTYVILNVGGSTTRVVIGRKRAIIELFCVPIGTIELNKLLQADPPNAEEIECLKTKIKESFERVSSKSILRNPVLIHTGGELDYILATGCKVEKSNLSPTHPYKVKLGDFQEFDQRIQYMTRKRLRLYKPDNPRWMDGAIASNALAIHVAKKFGLDELIPSNKNVTDGFLLEVAGYTKKSNDVGGD